MQIENTPYHLTLEQLRASEERYMARKRGDAVKALCVLFPLRDMYFLIAI